MASVICVRAGAGSVGTTGAEGTRGATGSLGAAGAGVGSGSDCEREATARDAGTTGLSDVVGVADGEMVGSDAWLTDVFAGDALLTGSTAAGVG